MEISKRCITILSILVRASGSYIPVRQIAQRLNISERTVHYDLDALERWSRDWGIDIERKRGSGVRIDSSSIPKAQKALQNADLLDSIILDSEQRSHRIIATLLLGDESTSFEELARQLDVSRSSILRDMDAVAAWFELHGIKLERHQKRGVRIPINEFQRRLVLVDFCREEVGLSPLSWSHSSHWGAEAGAPGLFGKLSRANLVSSIDLLSTYLSEKSAGFTDESFVMAVYYLAISRMRLEQGHAIVQAEIPPSASSRLDARAIFTLMLDTAFTAHNDNLQLTTDFIREQELAALAAVLDACGGSARAEQTETDLTVQLYEALIDRASQAAGVDFSIEHDLMKSLKSHVEALLARTHIGLQQGDPLFNEVERSYSDIWKACKLVFDLYSSKMKESVTDAEITYIVLYFAAAYERLRSTPASNRSLRVALVCGANVATVAFLEHALRETFPFLRVTKSLSVTQLGSCDYTHIDLILTTIDIDWVLPRPLIRVSPMLSKNDARRIDAFLRGNSSYMHDATGLDPVKDLMAIIEDSTEVQNRDALESNLKNYFAASARASRIDVSPHLPGLADATLERFTQANILASCWEDGLNMAASAMVEAGYMTTEYLSDILHLSKIYKQFGIIARGICLPHARPDRRNRLSLALITLSEPIIVDMGDGETIDVSVMFVLSSPDAASHTRVIDELFTIMANEGSLVEKLTSANTAEELHRVFIDICKDNGVTRQQRNLS